VISLKNQIKSLVAVLVAMLAAFTGVAAFLFQENFDDFTDFINERSKSHLTALTTLAEIETGLYLHQQSFACALASGMDKCLITLRETEQVVVDQFKFLETFNKGRFSDWIQAPDFNAADPDSELRELMTSYQAAPLTRTSRVEPWQRLYALVRADTENYFAATASRLKRHLEGVSADAEAETSDLTSEQKTLDLIFLGLSEIRERYNDKFWFDSQARDAVFTRDTNNYYRALLAGSSLLILLAGLIALLVHRHFRVQELHEENLVRLGTRDLATGLFNRKSLESMLSQEVGRAKRRNYALSVVLLRVEPFEKLRVELGQVATDRLFFQIAEVLRASCRAYDGIFKSDAHSFVIVMPEAPPRFINELCGRFLGRIGKKRFIVKSDQTKVAPTILAGAAAYPLNGSRPDELLKFAEMTLSPKFDARILEKDVGAMAGPAPATPAEENLPPEPALSDAPVQPEPPAASPPFSAASIIAKLKARASQVTNSEVSSPETAPTAEPSATSNVISLAKADADAPVEPDESAAQTADPDSPVGDTSVASLVEAAPQSEIFPVTETAPVPSDGAPPLKADQTEEELPDIVNALLQDEPEADSTQPVFEEPLHENEPSSYAPLTEPSSQPQEIQIVKTGQEDVIMVDFDREREDLAERFRRKRGQKPAAK
jgi:diguanylate cyclase (GGDEF)-like protein